MVSTKRRLSIDMSPVTPEMIQAVEKIVAPELATGKWETVESEAQIFGSDIMDQAIKEPTLDLFLDRNPKTLNFPDDYAAMVKVLRRQREIFITADAKRKDGIKKGMEIPNETNTSDAEED